LGLRVVCFGLRKRAGRDALRLPKRLTRDFLQARGVADDQLVDREGATEGTVKTEAAEAIADITSTGETLRANGLKPLSDGLIHASQATLYRSGTAPFGPAEKAALRQIEDRLSL
jgi:ATP phosphoribosyltransferase